MLSLALVAPVFWDVHKGSRIIVDEAMTTAAAAASAVIEEAGLGASRAVQVAGYALAVASLWSAHLPSGIWAGGFSTALPICLMETQR